jgi:hypothetical protein
MMFCKLLKLLIEHAPTSEIAAKLQAIYDAHCGAHTNLDSGDNGPPPHG